MFTISLIVGVLIGAYLEGLVAVLAVSSRFGGPIGAIGRAAVFGTLAYICDLDGEPLTSAISLGIACGIVGFIAGTDAATRLLRRRVAAMVPPKVIIDAPPPSRTVN